MDEAQDSAFPSIQSAGHEDTVRVRTGYWMPAVCSECAIAAWTDQPSGAATLETGQFRRCWYAESLSMPRWKVRKVGDLYHPFQRLIIYLMLHLWG